jgi:signal transduction histidine kinase
LTFRPLRPVSDGGSRGLAALKACPEDTDDGTVNRNREIVLGTALVSGGVTAVVTASPALQFAYHKPTLHVALETATAVVALLAAFLVLGRVRRTARLDELLILCGLGMLALASLFLAAVPSAFSDRSGTTIVWASITAKTLGRAVFAAGAFAPRRRIRRPRLGIPLAAITSVAAVAAAVLAARLLEARLPAIVTSSLAPESSSRPNLIANDWVFAVTLFAAVVYALAAVGFLRKAEFRADELFCWFSVASVFGFFAQLNFILYPSLYSQWAYTGFCFRLLFYIALSIGVSREIVSYWSDLAAAAVVAERRRIARDLHDGVLQELAFIQRNARLFGQPEEVELDLPQRIRMSSERAELEARRALAVLTDSRPEALSQTIADTATEVAERLGVDVELDLAREVELTDARAEAAVRIVAEAVTNAGRHSGAHRVIVSLARRKDRILLRVTDGGCGFDPGVQSQGFGIVSMQERARAAGGRLEVSSAPGAGTTVEAVL